MDYAWYNIGVNNLTILNKNWQFPKVTQLWGGHFTTEELFDPDWVLYIESLDIHISKSHPIFFKPKNMETKKAHVDLRLDNSSQVSALNFAIQGKDSKMCWYKEKLVNSGIIKQNSFGAADHKSHNHVVWNLEDLEEIDSCNIQSSLTLVRIGIPHTIFIGNQDRWGISIRFNNNLGRKSWEEVVDFFNNKNLLIAR